MVEQDQESPIPEQGKGTIAIEIQEVGNEDDTRRKQRQKQVSFYRELHSSLRASTHKQFDDDLLHRAVADAGRWAYGIMLVEVWALNDDRTILFRPEGGWYIDPMFELEKREEYQILARLTDPTREDYVAPLPLYPGEGLPGVLWNEATRKEARFRSDMSDTATSKFAELAKSSRLIWRNVDGIANDPDQPWNPRLQLFAKLGFSCAAAVPFEFQGRQGIVVYATRRGVDLRRLQSETNENYLISASDLIGAAFAMRGPRHRAELERRQEIHSAWSRVRHKILALRAMGIELRDVVKKEELKTKTEDTLVQRLEDAALETPVALKSLLLEIVARLASILRKSRGAAGAPPPAFSWPESLLTFVGVLLTFVVICIIQNALAAGLGSNYNLSLGPFGALVSLQYGLTQAPASQPRNTIHGQVVSMTIGVILGKAWPLPTLWRVSLSASLAIASMAKLGILHPPAGALSVVFASEGLGWGNMAFTLIASLVTIVMATFINNVSEKRQYPTYWGFFILESCVHRILPCGKGDLKKEVKNK